VALLGPRHPGIKLLAGVGLALLMLASVIDADYRVSARTVIEGSSELAIMSPFDGFIAESFVRAGDSVEKGQPLCRLDDRDLKLEQARWTADRDQLAHKYRVALSEQDRGAMGIISAQIAQAQAQLSLVDERLARATLVAPFDGVVVSGDLSQELGSPVEQGKLLFEVAPLSGYRVILQADERDIVDLAIGQRGELVLSGLPGESMHLAVRQLTSVSTTEDGRNFFRVEAQVDDPSPRLRLGMEGVGKVEVGERRLIWIWTHSLVDWARLAVWNWLP
jgi:multidrug efflux pump subunit AcrA (membrane-fusion protein)